MQDQLTIFDLTPGNVLGGRFEIKRQSRQGGLSAAFAVNDQKAGRDCELQLFPPALFETIEEAVDFARSWDPWKEVQSKAVAELFDVVRLDAGNLALLTSLPEGMSLRKVIEGGRTFSETEVLQLGLDLCAGLTELHGRGLAHGDIKPNTIWTSEVDGALEPCLVDGGVTSALWNAKHLGEHTALIGTPYYAPVEQFGGSEPDARSDVYNLCTVLYELATGVLPWDGSSFLEVFQSKLAPTPPAMSMRAPKAEVTRAFERAIAPGLSADRNDRYSSAAELGEALAKLVD
ncbi:MAG: serine/threonine-protein kinase [Planctomycetota bacterium]|nr:serine/threonine-protein kinase [Planctomycetota bacterium]